MRFVACDEPATAALMLRIEERLGVWVGQAPRLFLALGECDHAGGSASEAHPPACFLDGFDRILADRESMPPVETVGSTVDA
jgi:hypothetical protein